MSVKRVPKDSELTERERDVFHLISKGYTNRVIASKMAISLNTVKDHIARIKMRTGIKNRVLLALHWVEKDGEI